MKTWRIWVCGLLALCGCATSADRPPTESGDGAAVASGQKDVTRGFVTASMERMPLGTAIRTISHVSGAGIVVMNGLENTSVGPFEFSETPIAECVRSLAQGAKCSQTLADDYYFLYPEDYDMLNRVSVGSSLDARYNGLTADAAFSAGTRLYNVFAVLSEGLDITIVADNLVAESLSGELALMHADLAHTLEAILKSSRIPQRAVGIASNEEYIFLYRATNAPREGIFANREEFGGRIPGALRRRVNVTLPQPTKSSHEFPAYENASRLGDVVASLSDQLGIEVRLDQKGLESLPVNPSVMRNIRVETALELLIQQWLLQEFVFDYRGDGTVVIRHDDELAPTASF